MRMGQPYLPSTSRKHEAAKPCSWLQAVDPQERAAVEEAIMAAFVDNSEEAWDALLEATGAARYDDVRANAPAINVQHTQTGECHD